MDGQTDERMDVRKKGCLDVWMAGGWMDCLIDGWLSRRMDEWDGRWDCMDG